MKIRSDTLKDQEQALPFVIRDKNVEKIVR